MSSSFSPLRCPPLLPCSPGPLAPGILFVHDGGGSPQSSPASQEAKRIVQADRGLLDLLRETFGLSLSKAAGILRTGRLTGAGTGGASCRLDARGHQQTVVLQSEPYRTLRATPKAIADDGHARARRKDTWTLIRLDFDLDGILADFDASLRAVGAVPDPPPPPLNRPYRFLPTVLRDARCRMQQTILAPGFYRTPPLVNGVDVLAET